MKRQVAKVVMIIMQFIFYFVVNEQFERLPDGHEAKRSYYLGFRQAQSEARPNIVISLLKLN